MVRPTPQWSTSARSLEQRVLDPGGQDPLCLHSVYTRGLKTLEELAREGLVLAPFAARPEATSTMLFTEDYLAGDSELIFFSVNYPAPQMHGGNLCFDVETLASQGEVGFRPFDLIVLYRDIALQQGRLMGLEDFLTRTGARIGSKMRDAEVRQSIDNDPSTEGLRRYLRGFADCFTIWGESRVKAATEFWASLGGTIENYAEFLPEDVFLRELWDQPWFTPTRDHMQAFAREWGSFIQERTLWKEYFERARFAASVDYHVGEMLLRGELPICYARGVARWDNKPVVGSVIEWGDDVCEKSGR